MLLIKLYELLRNPSHFRQVLNLLGLLSEIIIGKNMKIKIKNAQIIQDLAGQTTVFPKYTTQIMNLANQNAQGTRPRVVGQMSELITQCPKGSYQEWCEWYSQRMPNAIDNATEKVFLMVQNLASAFRLIDKQMVRDWVTDLVFTKTFAGFRFQESILKTIADKKGLKYTCSTPEEESKGIDGYIGDTPVSIKPITYKAKNMYQENIEVKMIFYEKKKDGIKVEYDF